MSFKSENYINLYSIKYNYINLNYKISLKNQAKKENFLN